MISPRAFPGICPLLSPRLEPFLFQVFFTILSPSLLHPSITTIFVHNLPSPLSSSPTIPSPIQTFFPNPLPFLSPPPFQAECSCIRAPPKFLRRSIPTGLHMSFALCSLSALPSSLICKYLHLFYENFLTSQFKLDI